MHETSLQTGLYSEWGRGNCQRNAITPCPSGVVARPARGGNARPDAGNRVDAVDPVGGVANVGTTDSRGGDNRD